MPNLAIASDITTINDNAVQSSDNVKTEVLDAFGRTEAERTVVLSVSDAERIDAEVVAGEHQTYDDALTHVISRGLAEIKRSRKAAEELKQSRVVKANGKVFSDMLKMNPALVADPEFVGKMLAQLGVTMQAK
jgi:hypothetical protein